MERKVYDFFEGETMPEDCANRIEDRMTHRPKAAIQWRRFAAAAAAMLVLVLAVFNVDSICAQADSILDEITHALNPDIPRKIGKVEEGVYRGYSNLITEDNGSSSAWEGGSFVTVQDGRLYFTGNGEFIDITDLCSNDKAYIYPLNSGNGTIHYLCVGGTPDNYGYCEFIFDLNTEEQPWKTGGGSNHLDRNNNWEPYGWFVNVKETLGHPYPI